MFGIVHYELECHFRNWTRIGLVHTGQYKCTNTWYTEEEGEMNEEVGEQARWRRKGKEEEWMKRRKVEVQAYLLVAHGE